MRFDQIQILLLQIQKILSSCQKPTFSGKKSLFS